MGIRSFRATNLSSVGRGPSRTSRRTDVAVGSAASDAAERLFLDWLTGASKPDTVGLDGEGPETSLTWVLGVLCTSATRLPADAAAVLGRGPGITVGDAATELLLAVNDPAGPRCRSYRSAVLYLRQLRGVADLFDDV